MTTASVYYKESFFSESHINRSLVYPSLSPTLAPPLQSMIASFIVVIVVIGIGYVAANPLAYAMLRELVSAVYELTAEQKLFFLLLSATALITILYPHIKDQLVTEYFMTS